MRELRTAVFIGKQKLQGKFEPKYIFLNVIFLSSRWKGIGNEILQIYQSFQFSKVVEMF